MFQFQLVLLFYLILGIIARRMHLMNDAGKETLNNVLIYLVLPCTIINGFLNSVSVDVIRKSGTVLLAALGIQVFTFLIAKPIYGRSPERWRGQLEYSVLFPNFTFIGLPTCGVVFGPEGLALAAISHIVFRLFAWSVGLACFTGKVSKTGMLKAIFLHPAVLATLFGILLMSFQWTLPPFLMSALSGAGACTTPLAMILVGYILAGINWKETTKKQVTTLIGFTGLRLLALPAICFLAMRGLKIEAVITGVITLQTGTPTSPFTPLLGAKYGEDAEFGTQIVFLTTIFSFITIPLLVTILTA